MNMEKEPFTKIPNEVLEEMARSRVFCERTRVLCVILRKTAGWNKKEDWIALSQFEQMTGIGKPNVCRALRGLIKANIIVKSDNRYRINSLIKAWRELSKATKVIKSDKAHYQKRQSALSNQTDTKEAITKNISSQKKKYIHAHLMNKKDFEIFWKEYPKKVQKKKAKEKFLKIEKKLFGQIMEALEKQKRTTAWLENDGQFVPYPASWLNGERWEDDVKAMNFKKRDTERIQSGHVSTEGEADLIV